MWFPFCRSSIKTLRKISCSLSHHTCLNEHTWLLYILLLSLIYLSAESHIHRNTIHSHLYHIWILLSRNITHSWSYTHTRLSLNKVLLMSVLLLFLSISIIKTVKLIGIKLLISCEHLIFFY